MTPVKRTEKAPIPTLRIIPLGGVEEIGKNITAFEYGQDIVVVDCGLMFPQEDMLGIDYVIPDASYLVRNKNRVRAILFTHGHEDHIGATPYILPSLQGVPIYGTRLTLALIEHKLKEHHVSLPEMNVVAAGDTVKLGAFECEFIKISHSIAGSVAIALHTPVGVVVHTGDFKVDYTPVDDKPMDFGRFATLGQQGVLVLMADSTNVERTGYTMSERTVGETFNRLLSTARGRVIEAPFASNVHRVQQIIDAAVRYGRRVCISGRSMVNVCSLAMELGELFIPEGVLVPLERANMVENSELVIITTGSQGEAMSGLVRMARQDHRYINVQKGDTVILSANPIPGNEKYVSRLINQLYQQGAEVIYEALAEVHVSGHACQEELKLIYQLTKPKYFIPVHGEYRHLMRHAMLVEKMGHERQRIFVPAIGRTMEFSSRGARFADTVQAGPVLVDGLGVGDVGNAVLRDRHQLAEEGLVMAEVALDANTGTILAGPTVLSRGYVFVKENNDVMAELRDLVEQVVTDAVAAGNWDAGSLRSLMRESLRNRIYEQTNRNPVILPLVELIET
nr:ribonuclease J [bacterium]